MRAVETDLSELLVRLAQKAGAIAREEQDRARAELKPDQSYVTNVDLRLSELSVEMLRTVIPEDHIITEEHLEHAARVQATPGQSNELLAVVDPVDGTRNYFHNMPLYGFSVGILRNRRPWLGVVLFPALGELLQCDGRSVWFTRNLYSDGPERMALTGRDAELNYNSIVLCSETFTQRYRLDQMRYHLLQTSCATINLCWPAMGRGVGGVFGAHLWDLAGSWPILAMTGFILKGIQSGREIQAYDPADYDPNAHRIREPLLICRPHHFEALNAAISPADDAGGEV